MRNRSNHRPPTKAVWVGIILLLLTACDEPLPRPSKKGKDTFGCKINGKNFVPNGGGFLSGMKPLRGEYYEGDKKLNIHAFGHEEDKSGINSTTTIDLYVENVTGKGTYPINFDTNPPPNGTTYTSYGIYHFRDKKYLDPNTGIFGKTYTYITRAALPGKVKITKLDRSSKIIAGTFEFEAVNIQDPNDVAKITKGRFDIEF